MLSIVLDRQGVFLVSAYYSSRSARLAVFVGQAAFFLGIPRSGRILTEWLLGGDLLLQNTNRLQPHRREVRPVGYW